MLCYSCSHRVQGCAWRPCWSGTSPSNLGGAQRCMQRPGLVRPAAYGVHEPAPSARAALLLGRADAELTHLTKAPVLTATQASRPTGSSGGHFGRKPSPAQRSSGLGQRVAARPQPPHTYSPHTPARALNARASKQLGCSAVSACRTSASA